MPFKSKRKRLASNEGLDPPNLQDNSLAEQDLLRSNDRYLAQIAQLRLENIALFAQIQQLLMIINLCPQCRDQHVNWSNRGPPLSNSSSNIENAGTIDKHNCKCKRWCYTKFAPSTLEYFQKDYETLNVSKKYFFIFSTVFAKQSGAVREIQRQYFLKSIEVCRAFNLNVLKAS